MSGGIITSPAVRDRAPDLDDWAVVVRPLLAGIPVILVDQVRPSSSTHTVIAQTNIASVFLPINVNRRGATFFNNANAQLFIKLGGGVALNSFTVQLSRNGFYEVQWPTYTGVIEGVWSAAGPGDVQITELT